MQFSGLVGKLLGVVKRPAPLPVKVSDAWVGLNQGPSFQDLKAALPRGLREEHQRLGEWAERLPEWSDEFATYDVPPYEELSEEEKRKWRRLSELESLARQRLGSAKLDPKR